MSTCPFRFIHASDFHLERPLMGVADVPDHLRELFLEAPYKAARQVFDAALTEDANFVVLSGGIVVPSDTGPRGPLLLTEQFARLAERGSACTGPARRSTRRRRGPPPSSCRRTSTSFPAAKWRI